MIFYSINNETREVSEIHEPRTIATLSKMVGIAIGRWILSGLPCPDGTATDGVSAEEAALAWE